MKYAYAVDPCPFCAVLSEGIATAHAIALAQPAIWEPVGEVLRRFLTGFKPDGLSAGTTDSRLALPQVHRDPARCHT
jgi:hypothetical protein